MAKFSAIPQATTLVGDSVTDVQAAGIHRVGYANKPGKRERLTAAGAQVVIDSIAELAVALRVPRYRIPPDA